MSPFSLASTEFKRFKEWLPRLALAFLLLIPLLYGALYLWSYWDPYGKLDKMPVAVVNEDQTVTVTNPEGQPEQISAGKLFVEQLKENELFDWKFTDHQAAEKGVKDGTYYFSITVPVDFSERLASPLTGTPQRASVDMTLNDGNGYIAGVIASTAQVKLQEQLNAAANTAYANYALGDLTQVGSSLSQASSAADSLAKGASDAKSGSDSLVNGLAQMQNGASSLQSGTSQLSNAAAGVTTASQQTAMLLGQLAESYPQLSGDPRYQSAIQSAQTAASTASGMGQGINNASSGAANLASSLGTALSNEQQLSSGLGTLSQGASQLSTGLSSATENIPTLDDETRAKLANDLGSPVDVRTENLHPANVYGRGLAPFFFGIALWVFGLLCYSILRPIDVSAVTSRINAAVVTLGGWLPAFLVGLGGAIVLFLVTWIGLGLDPENALGVVGIMALAAAAFIAINQALRTWFGPIGLAASLVLLMFQLTSAGGLYPIETSPAIFQALNKVLPMGYFVEAMRVMISGGDSWYVIRAVIVLLVFAVIGFLATMAFVAYRRRSLGSGRDTGWRLWKVSPDVDL